MKITWIDVARGIAMLMVVGGHTIDWTHANTVDPVARVVLSLIVSCSLPLFFYVSGLLATRVPSMNWGDIFADKVAPLLWVFLLWQPAVFIYKLAAEYFLPGQDAVDLSTAIARLMISPVRPTGELWFIWALAFFFILARMLRSIPTWWLVGVAATLSVAWIGWAPASLVANVGVGWNGLLSYWVFFLLGLATNNLKLHMLTLPRWGAVLISVAWIAVVGALSILALTAIPVLSFIVKLLGLMGGLALARSFDCSRFLRYVGTATMPLYLTHTSLIVATLCVSTATGIAPIPWNGAGATLLWATAVSVGLAFDRLISATGATWITRDAPRWLLTALRLR